MSHSGCSVDLTKPHISDYTLYDFIIVVSSLHEDCMGKEWDDVAEALITRVSPCPDIARLLKDEHRYPRGLDELLTWYEERDLPGFKPE